jgi:anaphase-promoting complex subunit 1
LYISCLSSRIRNDIEAEQQSTLLTISNRTLALPFGSAIALFRVVKNSPNNDTKFPEFATSVRILPLNTLTKLDLAKLSPEFMEWPEFHLGVAMSLNARFQDGTLDPSWLEYHRPDTMSSTHAGFLLGQGLSKRLGGVSPWQSFNYLTPKHSTTTIGLLLGWAASCRGTMDPDITKLLSLHVSSLLPPNATQLNHSLITQTACMIGIGLVYQRSGDHAMGQKMLTEISNLQLLRTNLQEQCSYGEIDVSQYESYTLGAGIAFGMINLGKGGQGILSNEQGTLKRLRELITVNTFTGTKAVSGQLLMLLRSNR